MNSPCKTDTAVRRPFTLRTLLALSAILGGVVITVAAPTASAAPTGRVSIDPCLNLRSAPTPNSTLLDCVPNRTVVEIPYQTTGTSVSGPWGATSTWDCVTYNGKRGYIADAYVYTGTNGRVSGECPSNWSATTSSPPAQPTSSSSSYLSGNASVRWCAERSSFCTGTVASTLGKGTGVRMTCWTDTYVPSGSSSPRWFYLVASNGVEGYVHSSLVSRQTSVPNCSSVPRIRAAKWATDHHGAVNMTAAEKNYIGSGTGRWSGFCAGFVVSSFHFTGTNVPRTSSAAGNRQYYASRGQLRSGYAPARGTRVFWNVGQYGHEALSLGNGLFIGTRGYSNNSYPITTYTWNSYVSGNSYAGWANP